MKKPDALDKLLRAQAKRKMAASREVRRRLRAFEALLKRMTATQSALARRELAEFRALMRRTSDEALKRRIEGVLAAREVAKMERQQGRPKAPPN